MIGMSEAVVGAVVPFAVVVVAGADSLSAAGAVSKEGLPLGFVSVAVLDSVVVVPGAIPEDSRPQQRQSPKLSVEQASQRPSRNSGWKTRLWKVMMPVVLVPMTMNRWEESGLTRCFGVVVVVVVAAAVGCFVVARGTREDSTRPVVQLGIVWIAVAAAVR